MTDLGLMARKPVLLDIIASGEAEGHNLARALGPVSITAMGIGAGIFVLTGTAAAHYAGPGIMLSFVLGGVACAFVGLCYAELAALLPVCGSTYTYTYATLGELAAWIIGWDLVLEYAMGASTVAVGWSGYIVSLLHNVGIDVPPALAAAPGTQIKLADGSTVEGIVNIPAAFIISVLTAMLMLGTKESARVNNIMVALKLVVVLAFIQHRNAVAFVLVCGAVVYLRRSDAEVHRPFRVPNVPWVPLLPVADGRVAACDLDAPDRVAGHWARRVLCLWEPPLEAAPRLKLKTESICEGVATSTSGNR
jgi:amino acid transporter